MQCIQPNIRKISPFAVNRVWPLASSRFICTKLFAASMKRNRAQQSPSALWHIFRWSRANKKKNKWIKKFPLFVTKIERVTNLATSYRLVNSKIYMNKKCISIKGSAIAIGIVWYSFWICKFCKSIEFLIFHLFCRMLLCVYSCWHQPNFSSVLLVLGI